MSLAGYIGGDAGELRMPQSSADPVRIQTDGAVMSGERSVEEQRANDAIRTVRLRDRYYRRVEEYDPVLRSHCRL